METYTIRDKNGIMLMRVVGSNAEQIFDKLKGEWETYKAKGKKRTVCYTLSTDNVWQQETYQGAFQVFLWAGTKVIKD